VEVRQLFQLAEFEEVLRLQQAIWGFADIELLPLRFLVVVSQVGGHVFAAYDGGMMVGFCFAIPGIKPGGQPYLHSHMLGVLPAYQNAGIGQRLKLRQREEALARGIQLIEWTFDPLELKNAFLNIARLGAIVRRYHENQYGVTASPLHGGLPTDRCYAEWWIDSPRVRALLAADPAASALLERTAVGGPLRCTPDTPDPLVRPSADGCRGQQAGEGAGPEPYRGGRPSASAGQGQQADEGAGGPEPFRGGRRSADAGQGQQAGEDRGGTEPDLGVRYSPKGRPGGLPYTRIAYPADIARIRAANPRRAREIQKHNGEEFRRAFEQGLAVTGFERGDAEGTYLLEPWR
jgi:predicted GNAT superfamily acetyltransferase